MTMEYVDDAGLSEQRDERKEEYEGPTIKLYLRPIMYRGLSGWPISPPR
jgi:hypothetical protein